MGDAGNVLTGLTNVVSDFGITGSNPSSFLGLFGPEAGQTIGSDIGKVFGADPSTTTTLAETGAIVGGSQDVGQALGTATTGDPTSIPAQIGGGLDTAAKVIGSFFIPGAAATDAGTGAADISTSADLGGLTGAAGGTATQLGSAVQSGLGAAGTTGAVAGIPSGSGGGTAAGSSLGTDQAAPTLQGGATGAAQSPGSAALGTGAPSATKSEILQATSVARDANSALGFAQQLDALTGGATPATPPQPSQPQQQVTARSPSDLPVPSAGAQPVSQIAASAPSPFAAGEFQSITQDFIQQTQNAIRAQFANQNVSGSPQEQRQLQGVEALATQRASAAQQAMEAAGVSDPNVFAALMVSNINPAQFAQSLQQLRARRAI